jgi:S-adenosylmethionine:tRNA ribosyltransferase-isomerase
VDDGEVPDILTDAAPRADHTPDRPLSLDDLRYDLPAELIAQKPSATRSGSRLLHADKHRGMIWDDFFLSLPSLLKPGDLLVMNDTRVFRARLLGSCRGTGGRAELFLLKKLEDGRWKALTRPGKRSRTGTVLDFGGDLSCTVTERLDDGRAIVSFTSSGPVEPAIERLARVPLPPYIRREAEELDSERYQTVYASRSGAVAAPTAGLHFDRPLLERLASTGIETAWLTLHVGPGTFQPLRHSELERNRLDPEEYHVPPDTVRALTSARERGGRIVAVGTTATRVLETIGPETDPGGVSGETDLFIFPPYRFRMVDAMITNFHLPESSLLCLVAAFMGYDFMMEAYRHAVERGYRFYSYGDAMLIE